MRSVRPWLALAGAIALSMPVRADEVAGSFAEAVRNGTPILSLRYRFEEVSDDAFRSKDAHASTLRTVLGYSSADFKGWSLSLEAENTSAVGNDLYNNAGAGDRNNQVGDRPAVADPAGTGINQAYVRYAAGAAEVRVGRQEIVLGDSRFVGNVGWRQNHQSFDALRVTWTARDEVDVDYAWLENASRINGGNHGMSSHLLQGRIPLGADARLTLYGFLLDYDDAPQETLSSTTFGAELTGKRSLDDWSLLWEAEYALQQDAGDNPRAIDADYLHLMAGSRLATLTVKVGYEVLSGSPRDGQFRTPLATLHKFNGWADTFLSTPMDGLEDLSLEIAGTVAGLAWAVVFHDFNADTGGADYAEEIDLQLLYTAPWKQGFGLKGALYDAQDLAADTTKWMLWTTWSI